MCDWSLYIDSVFLSSGTQQKFSNSCCYPTIPKNKQCCYLTCDFQLRTVVLILSTVTIPCLMIKVSIHSLERPSSTSMPGVCISDNRSHWSGLQQLMPVHRLQHQWRQSPGLHLMVVCFRALGNDQACPPEQVVNTATIFSASVILCMPYRNRARPPPRLTSMTPISSGLFT